MILTLIFNDSIILLYKKDTNLFIWLNKTINFAIIWDIFLN